MGNKKIKPTSEQKRVFHYVEKRPENIFIRALAGSGKTTTIIEASKLIPKDKSIMFLAFNKHIQEELKTKLPEHIRCYTTYGLGVSAIKRKYGDKIQLDEFKVDKLIKKYQRIWKLEQEFKSMDTLDEYLFNLKKMVDLCRVTLTLKKEYVGYVARKHEIKIDEKRDIKRILKLLDEVTLDRKTFDFVDMIYMPATDKSIWMFPQDYVLIDEIQDISMAQYQIVMKLLKRDRKTGKQIGRLISVGDEFQAIYGFNGADEKMFKRFEDLPNTVTLPLTTSFRCSKRVIRKAQTIVPKIKALDSAPEGDVRDGSVLKEAQDGDFVLCRTTAPLVKLFFEFISEGKKAVIRGSDIGLQLIGLIGKFKDLKKLKNHWEDVLYTTYGELKVAGVLEPEKDSGYVALNDKVTVLKYLIDVSISVDELKHKIKSIFTDELSGIVLSTVHKSKGLESDRVFIIRPDLLPLDNVIGWQYQQERNLEYVAITRAKIELIYDREWTDEENELSVKKENDSEENELTNN